MIKAYGRFWHRELVDWGKPGRGGKGSLRGIMTPSNVLTDCWDQQGIYVLYNDFDLQYVGSATMSIGERLRTHRRDHMQERWNRFSWYGIRQINQDGKLRKVSSAIPRQDKNEFIILLEAIAIFIADPPLNKISGAIYQPIECVQRRDAEPLPSERKLLAEILEHIREK